MIFRWRWFSAAVALAMGAGSMAAAEKNVLPVAELHRAEPVDFNREVLPFLSDNCLSCHCQSTSKGGLNLETPELMLKGGDTGPSIVPGKAAESLCFQAAIHEDPDLTMPPRENKAKAKNLTPEQLALLRLWIEQGAKPSAKVARVLQWQTLPASLGAIFAVAVTPDGQFAACSRADRLFVYHLPSARCVLNILAQRDQINALAFNPEGTLLATAGYREVKLWRRARETRLFTLADAGTGAAVSPDGKWIAAAGEDGSIKLWAWPGEAPPRTVATDLGPVAALAFSPDSAVLAAAGEKSLGLWKVDSAELAAKADTPAGTLALAWMPEGKQLAAAGADHRIRIWSDSLAPGGELAGHGGPVTALAAAGPGRLLSGSADGSARLWDVAKSQVLLQMDHGAPVTAVAARADGARFASAGENGVAKLWDAAGKAAGEMRGNRYTGEQAAACERQLQSGTATVAFRKDALGAAEKLVAPAEERVKKAQETLAAKEKDLEGKKASLAQAQGEKMTAEQALVALEEQIKQATEKLAAAEKLAQDTEAAVPPVPEDIAKTKADAAAAKTALAEREAQRKPSTDKIAPAAKKVMEAEAAAAKSDLERADAAKALSQAQTEVQQTTAAIADAKSAAEAAEQARQQADTALQAARQAVTAADKPIRSIAFSPDSVTVATAGDDGLVHTWSATGGAPFEVLAGHAAPIAALAFAPHGELLSSARDRALIGWDLAVHWTLERTLGSSDGESPFADRVNALAFSRDGKLLATGGGEPSRGGEIKLWEVETGQLVRDLPRLHADAVLGLDFSPDGKYLASGAADKLMRVTDLATGQMVRTFEGHTHHVLAVAWSLDGRTIATAGADNMVKIWDFATGTAKKNIEGYEKEVTAVHFAGAGETLVTSSGDNRVRLVNTGGAEVRSFPAVSDFMEGAAITADGKTVLAGGQDSILRVWNADDGKPLATFGK